MNVAQLSPWLRLHAIDGVGDRIMVKLVQVFGGPDRVLAAEAADLIQAGCSPELAGAIRRGADTAALRRIDRQVADVERCSIRVMAFTEPTYPQRLAAIPDPPPLLYYTGEWRERDALAVAIVGGRQASPAGRALTEDIAAALAEAGWTVVSGMARGIDAAAHRGALAAQGRTIAVLGCGVDRTYPPEHDELRRQIDAQGIVVSELPVGMPPQSHHFPKRNRIISGLSLGVLVAEARVSSGSLITAALALEQGREVFALPGSPRDERCRGSNRLIRDGAKLIESAADILEELAPQVDVAPASGAVRSTARSGTLGALTPEEQRVYDILSDEAQPVDAVIEQAGLSAAQVSATLLALELRGHVRQLPGQQYVRR